MSQDKKNVHIADESGLKKELSTAQLTMIAIGGAVGTGLFMGSGFAISKAGPAVIFSYVIGALIALIMMGTLSEMTVSQPTAGSFGVYAEQYVNPWAGFVVRYSYWLCIVVAIGTEVTAVGIYMQYWFPQIPAMFWILGFSIALIIVNITSAKNFANFEFVFASIKVIAIVIFILVGCYVVFGAPQNHPEITFANYTNDGGFVPFGIGGILIGAFVALFSYFSMEMIAITAGEAKDPEVAVPKALRSAIARLFIFYILSLGIMLAMVPWRQAGVGESPFVTAFSMVGIPFASGIMNFVVLTAALSAMNSMLYVSSRMIFSLSRGGYAPKSLGDLSKNGVPVKALIISSLGIALAAVVNQVIASGEGQFLTMMGISMFGPVFTWFMIMVTHLFFRKKWEAAGGKKLAVRMPWYPYSTWLGIILISVCFIYASVKEFKVTLYTGIPWFIFISIVYFVWFAKKDKLRK